MEQETVKTCKCCGRTLDISNFKKGRWGYVSVCLDCDKKHRAEKRQARLDEQKQKVENVRAENRQLCLADFTPRELMAELKRRGYEGNLTYTETHTIDLSKL
jgi:ribosome-binding protein aMBF1 (putative translation factor)